VRSAVIHAHELLRSSVGAGDTVIDATAGNGHDTIFLAQLIAPGGKVFAFDIQPEALAATRRRLEEAGVSPDLFELIPSGHETMEDRIPPPWHGRVAAIVFNLGYLPGGDKSVITSPVTTIAAMNCATRLLRPGGILVAVLYTGHPGGMDEEAAVKTFASGLPAVHWQVEWHAPPKTLRPAPSVLYIRHLPVPAH
jgi:SAM-dependent methyltransferase